MTGQVRGRGDRSVVWLSKRELEVLAGRTAAVGGTAAVGFGQSTRGWFGVLAARSASNCRHPETLPCTPSNPGSSPSMNPVLEKRFPSKKNFPILRAVQVHLECRESFRPRAPRGLPCRRTSRASERHWEAGRGSHSDRCSRRKCGPTQGEIGSEPRDGGVGPPGDEAASGNSSWRAVLSAGI